MPETAVDEHCYSKSRKRNVNSPTDIFEGTNLEPIAKAQCRKRSPKTELWLRVARPLSLKPGTHMIGRCHRCSVHLAILLQRQTGLVPFNQDDQRERAMIDVLNLDQRPDRGRQDEDAHLDVMVDGVATTLLFELKSKPKGGDYGTGRDTGPRQLQRWSAMHFAFGVFEVRDDRVSELWYGSPRMMEPWIRAELDYVRPDGILADRLPALIGEAEMIAVFGDKARYTYDDLRRVMKDLWSADAASNRSNLYDARADIHSGTPRADNVYSREAALQACRDRATYLMRRGATVNNRKISTRFVEEHCRLLERPYANALRNAIADETGN